MTLYLLIIITRGIKTEKMRLTEYVARMEKTRNESKIVAAMPEANNPVQRPSR
jgi:hypothetical protein